MRRCSAARCPLAQVAAVERDPAARRLVEPREQLDQRGLARAVLADDRELAAGRDVQVDAVERELARARIRERRRPRSARRRRASVPSVAVPPRRHRRRVEELVEVRQVQVVLVHAADVAERARHRGLRLLEHEDVHRHRADRDRAVDRRRARSTGTCRRTRPWPIVPRIERPDRRGGS